MPTDPKPPRGVHKNRPKRFRGHLDNRVFVIAAAVTFYAILAELPGGDTVTPSKRDWLSSSKEIRNSALR
jgi:hypothetical protein